MINFFKKSSRKPIIDIDITELWLKSHPHLLPYEDGQADEGVVRLFANIQFQGTTWIEMVELVFNRNLRRFFIPISSQEQIHKNTPNLDCRNISAIDARLWFSKPTMINIEPTTRCNYNCWYCVGQHMTQADIRLEDFSLMLENFPDVKTIALVGEGEPLLHKDFFKMAQMAKDRAIKVLIISNGSAFSQSVIRQLCETAVAYVSISIDSADSKTFSESRIDGNLEKVWQGIRNLRNYRDTHGYEFPKIALKGTLFENTRNQLPGIALKAKENGVEIFESFQPLNPMHNYVRIYPKAHLNELTHINDVQAAINTDSIVARNYLKPFTSFCEEQKIDFSPTVNKNPKTKNCDETWLYSLLSGDVTPCCQVKTPPSENWNIFKKTTGEILSDKEYENMRFNLWNGIFPKYCNGCWKTR